MPPADPSRLVGKFHDKSGELIVAEKSGEVIVKGDVDGDGKADFGLTVVGVTSLGANDFSL